MSEDLYGLLELNRSASEADIKKAYRQLARKYHPDVNKEAGAEARFKKIQKAYAILSDPQKKAQYDQFGIADDSPGGGQGGFGGFGQGAGFEGGFEDIFDVFFGGERRGGGGGRSGPRRGEDLRYDLELTLEDVAAGVSKELEIFHLDACSRCQGDGAQPGTGKTTCSHCNGAGQIRSVQRTMLGSFSQVTTCHHCAGAGQVIKNPCLLCHGKGVEKKKKRIKVDIPAGVDRGSKLRVSNEGNRGEQGGPAGDLYVFISVKEHAYFERHDDDVYLEVEIPFTRAILGTEIEVPTLTGKAKITIPSGTQPHTVLRLKGKGIPHFRGFGSGDQHVRVIVTIPKRLSGKEKGMIKDYAESAGDLKDHKSMLDAVKRRR